MASEVYKSEDKPVHEEGIQTAALPDCPMSIHQVARSQRGGGRGRGRGSSRSAVDTQKTIAGNTEEVIDAPPDGGITAWLQVLAGHLVLFNTWGYMNSFGIFQGLYEQRLSLAPSAVSRIGSVQVFLVFFLGSLSGRALDAGHYRTVLWIGTLLELVGVFTTSLSTKYWQLFLAQGIAQATGAGLFFGLTMALASTYFSRRRTIAISIVASGAATGGLIFPLIARQLLPTVGFGWTVRIIGFVILFNSGVILACTRTRLPPRRLGPLLELVAFREPAYLLFAIGAFFTFWGTYYTYYYTRLFAVNVLDASQAQSFGLLMAINAVGVPGRLVPALLADQFAIRPIFVLTPCILIAGLLLYLWAAVRNLGGDYAWTLAFGAVSAAIQGLFPATCASLVPDLNRRGSRIGVLFSIVAVACLTGPPLAGRLLQEARGSSEKIFHTSLLSFTVLDTITYDIHHTQGQREQ